MPIITPERAGEIRAKTCEKYGAIWLHHYHEAIEAEVLKAIGWEEVVQTSVDQSLALSHIADLAHDKSTGPAVPDTLWEIRNIAQEAL
jgi:hypothetical protein